MDDALQADAMHIVPSTKAIILQFPPPDPSDGFLIIAIRESIDEAIRGAFSVPSHLLGSRSHVRSYDSEGDTDEAWEEGVHEMIARVRQRERNS